MTGYDDLERQLRDSVKRRARHRAIRPWLWPGRRLAVALAPLALVGGVATAATQLTGAATTRGKGPRELAYQATRDTAHDPACERARHGVADVIDTPPPPAIAAGLPVTTRAPTTVPVRLREFARRHAGGPIFASTLRLIPVGGGRRILLFVSPGQDDFTLADPAACLRAREARLAELVPDAQSPRRRAADAVLRERRDSRVGLVTLDLLAIPPGRPRPSFGTGIALAPGSPVPTGVLVSGGGEYAGIAKPAATRIALRGRRYRRTVAVHDGVFAFALPRRTGSIALNQLAADGKVLARQRLRQ